MGTRKVAQHHIDQQARIIFAEALSSWAQPNRHTDADYAIDYTAEIFEPVDNGTSVAKGYDFQIQLKGTSRLKKNHGHVRISLEVADLVYYLDDKHLPVFLVVVDVTTRLGYWIFLQQYLAESILGEWRSKKTLQILVPVENAISPAATMRQAVLSSNAWMREHRPGSPQSALKGLTRDLQKKDPRLEYKVSAEVGLTKIELSAKEPVPFEITVDGDVAAKQAFAESAAFGLEVRPAEINATVRVLGSPVFPSGPVKSIRIGQQVQCTVVVTRHRANRLEQSAFQIESVFSMGTHGLSGQARIGKELLCLDLKARAISPTEFSVEYNWHFSRVEWHGRSLLGHIPDLDRIAPVFCDSEVGDWLEVALVQEGLQVFSITLDPDESKTIFRATGFVEVVRRLRALARFVRRDFPIPESMSGEDLDKLLTFWNIQHGLSANATVNKCTFIIERPKHEAAEVARLHGATETFSTVMTRFEIPLLGQLVDVGPVLVEIDRARVKIDLITDLDDSPNVQAFLRLDGPTTATVRAIQNPELRAR